MGHCDDFNTEADRSMNKLEAISSQSAAPAIGPYSQGIIAGDFLYVSGQLPSSHDGSPVPDGIGAQTRLVLHNIEAIAREAGCTLADLAKLTVFMTDLSKLESVNEAMASMLNTPYPARSTVQVTALPKSSQIEIDAVLKLADKGE